MLRTGWSEEYLGTDRYFEHPFLDPGACERVLELGVRTFAIDTLNPDPTVLEGKVDLPVHRLVLGAGGVIAENLTNLSSVGDAEPLVCLFPIRLGETLTARRAGPSPCSSRLDDLHPVTNLCDFTLSPSSETITPCSAPSM